MRAMHHVAWTVTMTEREVKANKADDQRAITAAYKAITGDPVVRATWVGKSFEYDGRMVMRVAYKNGFANGYGKCSPWSFAWVYCEEA